MTLSRWRTRAWLQGWAALGITIGFAVMRTLAHGRELLMLNEATLDAAGEGIFAIAADGTVTLANPAAARMTLYRSEEIIGRELHGLVHHTKPDGTPYPASECPMLASLDDGAIHHADCDVYWRTDGSSFPVEFTSTPIADGDRIKGAVVVFRDVGERREIERVKGEFAAVVSHVVVSDGGRGIPEAKLEAIFERFQQVDASDSRAKGGTGLGLAICRSIVEHHGGRIWAQSVLGVGSAFTFVVPAATARTTLNHAQPSERSHAQEAPPVGR